MKKIKQPKGGRGAEAGGKIEAQNGGETPSYMLPASILAAGIIIAASIIYLVKSGGAGNAPNAGGGTPQNQNNNPAAVAGAADIKLSASDVVLGSASAPVTFVEYGDYQCPFCGRFFTDVEPQLKKNYINTGKIKFIFRNFQFLGQESTAAAEAVECAKDQNKFWEYHDAVYAAEVADGHENNGNLNRDLFVKLAADVGLNKNAFGQCLDSGKYAGKINQDYADAQKIGVNSTPTSFVNGQKVQGALPYAQFESIIDNALKAK